MNASLTVSLIVAVIASGGLVLIRLMRKPVDIQELWAENRALRVEVNGLRDRIDETENRFEERDRGRMRLIGVLSSGMDVLWHYLELVRTQWPGPSPMPELSAGEHTIIDAARHMRGELDLDPTGATK